jgi:ABC-2 type transport system ATP-binding protein
MKATLPYNYEDRSIKMNVTKNNNLEGNVVETLELTKLFGESRAVDAVTMQVPQGTIFGFIGPSGCGKTTTVRLLTGIYSPTSGQVSVLGKNPVDFTKTDREKIGYLVQHVVLYPELTVWENLNFAASIYGVNPFRRGHLRKLLDFVELSRDSSKRASQLSGGMQRRLGLAAALVHNPQLLFLDEPTAGIDPILRRKFWDYFKELQQQGHTLFVTTQYVGEAAYCDLVGVMYEGRLLMVETPENLRRRAFGGDIISVRTTEEIRYTHRHEIENLPFVRGRVKLLSDQEIEVTVENASTALALLVEYLNSQRFNTEVIEQKVLPFDDVFVKLIETEKVNA